MQDQLRLNLQKDSEGLHECCGRIQGSYPIYLPASAVLSEKLVQDVHILMLHGRVGLTVTFIRHNYWMAWPRFQGSKL